MALPQNILEKIEEMQLRPTLVIGIGGTGQKVLVQLKARFLRNYGMIPPPIEFLCFDTDQAEEQVQLDGQSISLTRPTEMINIGGVQVANILRRLDINPTISTWLSEDKDHRAINTQALTQGAKQVRPLGRISFFYHVVNIFDKLKASVGRLGGLKLKGKKEGALGINVFIVSSVCGGTGSSCMIDMAYLVRHVMQGRGIETQCKINGVFALPSVFPTVEQLGIESNAFATMRELDYFMENGTWDCVYNSPVDHVSFQGISPFNICYLVDSINERGQGLAGMEEIAPMIAEAMYLQISSQVGDTTNSAFDNVKATTDKVMSYDENKLKITSYSGLGTSSLVFPAMRIIELCAQRLGRDLIGNHLLKSGVGLGKIEERFAAFLQSRQLESELLLQEIARDAKKNLLKVNLQSSVLNDFKDAELFARTKQYVAKGEDTVDNEWSQILDGNRKRLHDELIIAITNETDALMDDATLGAVATLAFLNKLDERLTVTRRQYDAARTEKEQARTKIQAQLRQTEVAFDDALKSINPFGKGGRIRGARDNHVQTFQNYLVAKFEAKKREVALGLLATLGQSIQARKSALQNLINRMGLIQSQFAAFVERSTGRSGSRTDFVLAQDITTDADVDQYYQQHLEQLGEFPAAAVLTTQGPLHSWLNLDQEAISKRILSYSRNLFEDIKQIAIEDIIVAKRGKIDPQTRLERLKEISVPFWSYQVAGRMERDPSEKIMAIGVFDKENSIYKETVMRGETLASTFDKHAITVLHTKHGVPFFALTLYTSFKSKHDQVLRNGLKPLYVFPQVRPGGERAKLYFALGLIYGLIYKSGVTYYMLPPDVLDPIIQLGRGMAESLREFRSEEDRVREIVKQVDTKTSLAGLENATKTATEFVDKPFVREFSGRDRPKEPEKLTQDFSIGLPNSTNIELVTELRRLVRTYIDKELRA